MSGNETDIAPIDYLIVEWPVGSPPNGEAFPLLLDLVDRGLIRVLDLSFIQKDETGQVIAIDIANLDLENNPDLAVFVGASSGLLGEDDHQEAGNALQPGSSAAILIYENLWSAPFASSLRRAGAQLVSYGHIPVNAVIAALDELEAAEA